MKILLVEDDPLDVELTQRELGRAFADIQLVVTATIADAWRTLQAGMEFDIVLTDLRLPDGAGLDLVYHIRLADLPCAVVVLTGQGDETTAVSAIKLGADDYIAKRPGYHQRLPQIVITAINRFRQESKRRSSLLRVLYAEHHQADIELTRRHLARHAPHIHLEIVHNSAEVMARLQPTHGTELSYDVLLLDFNLAGDNALDLLKLLHDESQFYLPVVLVTGQGDEEIAAQALRLGANDYIVKHTGYLYELPVALENAHFRTRLAREQAAFQVSEARFRRLTENASDLIYRYVYSPAPHFDYISPALLPMTGYHPHEVYADPQLVYRIIHPEDCPAFDNVLSGKVDTKTPLVLRWLQRDGTLLWTEQRSTLLYDDNGRLVALEGIVRDITQSRQALEKLHDHLGEMQALQRVSNALRTAQTVTEAVQVLLDQTLAALQTDAGAVWLYDEDQGILRITSASGWCRKLAQSTIAPGESITGSVFTSAAPHIEDDVAISPLIADEVRSLVPQGWSGGWAPIRTSDADVGVMFVAVQKPNTVTPEKIKLVVSLAEMAGSIFQRLRLFQQAQAQADLTRQIVNTVPEGLALVDHQRRILLANAPAEAILHDLDRLIDSAIAESIAEYNLTTTVAPPAVAWRELQFQGRTWILNVQPVEPGNPTTSWVLVMDDVTTEREQQRYQEAQDRLATVGQLAAGIAHDFNNVLGVISVYADLMQAAPNLTPRQQQQLATVVDQAHHAASLVRQVLDFSRRSVMERTTIDLEMLVNEQIKLLKRTLSENIQLHLRSDEKHLHVSADPTRLRQVLMNLAINARDAMPHGGVLTFSLSHIILRDDKTAPSPLPDMAPGEWVRMTIADTGLGIAPANLPHIFEPFFTTKTPGQGTGLGLAQVYGIVKQHGGAIHVSSALGQGTTFELYLPLSAEEAQPMVATQAAQQHSGSECILLVEDNIELCIAVAQSLESLGYRILQAFDGSTALQLASQPGVVIDLLLSDMVMPGWNGLDLFAALQKQHPAAALLIMTGHPLSHPHSQALQNLAGFWIQKPFALSELATRVRATLSRKHA